MAGGECVLPLFLSQCQSHRWSTCQESAKRMLVSTTRTAGMYINTLEVAEIFPFVLNFTAHHGRGGRGWGGGKKAQRSEVHAPRSPLHGRSVPWRQLDRRLHLPRAPEDGLLPSLRSVLCRGVARLEDSCPIFAGMDDQIMCRLFLNHSQMSSNPQARSRVGWRM